MSVKVVLSTNDQFFRDKPFAWEGILFTTVQEFEAYLARPEIRAKVRSWATGVTLHHTDRPTIAQWTAAGGYASLKGVVRTWRDTNGWETGPNMIIAPEGIYLASGILAPGIHAGVCNNTHIGIEVVGNYDKAGWKEPIRGFVYGAVRALVNIGASKINGHRECNSPKTCPGTAIDLNQFRKDLSNNVTKENRTVIGVRPSITLTQFKRYLTKYKAPLPLGEMDRIYYLAEWLDIDPAFFAALWKQEAFVDNRIGNSEVQNLSNCPINIVEHESSTRRKVYWNKRWWRAFSTRQLGCMDALVYLKDFHGAAGRLGVREIIAVHSPKIDGNDVEQIIKNIFTRMDEMKGL